MAGYLMVRDTDVWENKASGKKYNPVKVESGYDDYIILREIESGEDEKVRIGAFRNDYDRVQLGKPFKKQFFV